MYFCAMAAEMASDTGCHLHHADGVDAKAIRRAALITLRRAMFQRLPPGPQRRAWLQWLVELTARNPAKCYREKQRDGQCKQYPVRINLPPISHWLA
jgi:hypothetical protein